MLELNPSAADLHYRIARIAFSDGDFGKCVTHLDALLAASPDTVEALRMKGYAEVRLGHLAEGRAAFKRYLELVPNAPDMAQVDAVLGK